MWGRNSSTQPLMKSSSERFRGGALAFTFEEVGDLAFSIKFGEEPASEKCDLLTHVTKRAESELLFDIFDIFDRFEMLFEARVEKCPF